MTAEQQRRRREKLDSPARILGGRIGQQKVPVEVRTKRSSAAGNRVLSQYGQDFYSALGQLSAKKKRQSIQVIANAETV